MPENLDIKYFQNRSHLLQLYAHPHRAGDVWYNYDAWELPVGSEVIQLSYNYIPQLFRTYGRFVWTKLVLKFLPLTKTESIQKGSPFTKTERRKL